MYQVNVYSNDTEGYVYITNHFKVKEFACNDGTNQVFISPKLVQVLEQVREYFGKPIYINSGYRTVEYNSITPNSSKESMHCKGIAADFYITGVKPKAIYDYLNKLYPNKYCLGLYNSFVHLDIRSTKARW